MVHLPPGCIFTVHPADPDPDPDSDGKAESRLGGVIEKDDTAHCYRDHFLGKVTGWKHTAICNNADMEFPCCDPVLHHQGYSFWSFLKEIVFFLASVLVCESLL